MNLSVIIKLLIRINFIPLSFGQESGKFYFSWFSLRTILNLFLLYGLSLSCLIYYTFTDFTFVIDTPMEFARYVKILKGISWFSWHLLWKSDLIFFTTYCIIYPAVPALTGRLLAPFTFAFIRKSSSLSKL